LPSLQHPPATTGCLYPHPQHPAWDRCGLYPTPYPPSTCRGVPMVATVRYCGLRQRHYLRRALQVYANAASPALLRTSFPFPPLVCLFAPHHLSGPRRPGFWVDGTEFRAVAYISIMINPRRRRPSPRKIIGAGGANLRWKRLAAAREMARTIYNRRRRSRCRAVMTWHIVAAMLIGSGVVLIPADRISAWHKQRVAKRSGIGGDKHLMVNSEQA